MTAKTMAEVLAEHVIIGHGRTGTYACTNTECGWELVYRGRMDGLMLGGIDPVARQFAAHQQDMLTAAGFGLVADAKAEAWDRGHHDGAVDQMLHMENDGAKTTPNPYRAAS